MLQISRSLPIMTPFYPQYEDVFSQDQLFLSRKISNHTKPVNMSFVLQGCLLWGSRVVIPKKCYATVLKELHEIHQGVNKMKSLAKSYM